VNPSSITIELNVLNFKFDFFDSLVAENSLLATDRCSLQRFVVQMVPPQGKDGWDVLCNWISKCFEKCWYSVQIKEV